ncbi:DUF2442 domain-containing protein [Oxalobacteraceae bacterium CAVE-383]|nr:DUF2442 domain-containing protein [Oxalobacteraceae bacterium CAVE-383]
MVAIRDCIESADQSGAAAKAAFPAAVAVRYDRRVARVIIVLASGLELGFSPKQAQGLETARPIDLSNAEISPSGMGIYFPRLDVDLYIPAMLEGFLGSRRWMAAEIGKLGGKSSSAAKAAAARKNGKLGGRPKKPRD